MKFLVLALCVCAASAASIDFNPYKPYQPEQYQRYRQPVQQLGQYQQQYQGYRQPAVTAKVYNPTAFDVPVQQPYKTVQVVPNVVTRTSYEPAEVAVAPVVTAAPVVAASPVIETAEVVAAAPVVEAKNIIENVASVYEKKPVPVVPKAVFEVKPVVAKPFPEISARTAYNSGKESEAPILRYENDVNAEGFNSVFETANGIAAQSTGNLKNVDGNAALVIEGSYQYPSPDGTFVQISYTADENGFQPRGDILPVGPPVPEAILRSLQYIAAHPPKYE